jgi:single-strand DNA-binding protein
MEIIGRLTTDAKISELKNGKKVVNFSIAINDGYKPKDGEVKVSTTFVNCAYWINSGIANYLTKGSLVELFGRIGVNAWKNAEGEAKAVLTLHVNNIKFHGKPINKLAAAATGDQNQFKETSDDLPF